MTHRGPGWLPAVALIGMLAGCGGGGTATPAPSTAPPTATAPVAPPPSASAAQNGTACQDYDTMVSTVRGIADALRQGPVLPAGVDLFLLGPRQQASAPQPADPELTAARAELVAAIDDIDAQGRRLLPPGGNAARDPVQLDPGRILAAAAQIETLCSRR